MKSCWRGKKDGEIKSLTVVICFVLIFVYLLVCFVFFCGWDDVGVSRGYGGTSRWAELEYMMWNFQRINKEVKFWKRSCYLETCLILETYYSYITIMLFSSFPCVSVGMILKRFSLFFKCYVICICVSMGTWMQWRTQALNSPVLKL